MAESCDGKNHPPLPPREEVVVFPCDYVFKAFGPNTPEFVVAVRAAISRTLFAAADATKVRPSSQGEYQCVSVVVRLQKSEELEAIYRDLQALAELKYLL